MLPPTKIMRREEEKGQGKGRRSERDAETVIQMEPTG